MFIWTRAMERLAGLLASVGPVCSSPLRGYNSMPDTPLNIIDFHGLKDKTIPFSPDLPTNLGDGELGPLGVTEVLTIIEIVGPDGTVISNDGWYYHIKMEYLTEVIQHMNCDPASSVYPTHMDGSHGFNCQVWGGCDQGKEVVQCNGNWTHDYPFSNRYIEGVKILWDFMKTHPQQ